MRDISLCLTVLMKCGHCYISISTNPPFHFLPREQLKRSLRHDLCQTLAYCFNLRAHSITHQQTVTMIHETNTWNTHHRVAESALSSSQSVNDSLWLIQPKWDPECGTLYLKNSDSTEASDSLGANWNRTCLSRLLNHGALWQTVFLCLINILTYLLTYTSISITTTFILSAIFLLNPGQLVSLGSFVRFIRGGGWLLAVFRHAFSLPPALRPRHGPVCVPSNPEACTIYL